MFSVCGHLQMCQGPPGGQLASAEKDCFEAPCPELNRLALLLSGKVGSKTPNCTPANLAIWPAAIHSVFYIYLRDSSVSCCCLVVKLCLTLCDPMVQSTPGPPVFHCLLELGQIYVGSISSSVVPFSSCLHSFPTSGFFPRSLLFS